jgi:hypothetical protein
MKISFFFYSNITTLKYYKNKAFDNMNWHSVARNALSTFGMGNFYTIN